MRKSRHLKKAGKTRLKNSKILSKMKSKPNVDSRLDAKSGAKSVARKTARKTAQKMGSPKSLGGSSKAAMNYKSSGVDVAAGDDLVDWLQKTGRVQPHQEKIIDGIGGFASLFRADFSHLEKPCLVTCTDGVGTKVKLASHFQDYSGVGQDLVAMCVNDLICTGGEPLLFLDYYATGKLNQKAAREFLQSVREACFQSDCALVGGETAEMPGVYRDNDFDCAGFAVGIVDQVKSLGPHRVKEGDRVLGVSSSGFHSNGYSLIRKVFARDLKKYREDLLRPTALYVKLAKTLREIDIHALAHITGGGIENVPRVLPESLEWIRADWEWPPIFKEVQKRTGMSDLEMLTTLNCGVGLVIILPEAGCARAREIVKNSGFKVYDLGVIQRNSQNLGMPGSDS